MDLCERLYNSGTRLTSGGLIAGLISMALEAMFSVYGAITRAAGGAGVPLYVSANMTAGKLLAMWQGREAGRVRAGGRARDKACQDKE